MTSYRQFAKNVAAAVAIMVTTASSFGAAPDNPLRGELTDTLCDFGWEAIDDGQYQAALGYFSYALDCNPRSTRALTGRG